MRRRFESALVLFGTWRSRRLKVPYIGTHDNDTYGCQLNVGWLITWWELIATPTGEDGEEVGETCEGINCSALECPGFGSIQMPVGSGSSPSSILEPMDNRYSRSGRIHDGFFSFIG